MEKFICILICLARFFSLLVVLVRDLTLAKYIINSQNFELFKKKIINLTKEENHKLHFFK